MLRPFAHPVACCWVLSVVVAHSLKLSHQLSTFFFGSVIAEASAAMLDPLAQLFQH